MQTLDKLPPEQNNLNSTAVVGMENAPLDPDCLTHEDCQYLLRALEKQAFKHVVSALRAQGPLSQYREVILDHLRTIFFISDEEFQLQLRISSSDPILTRIAEELNPSYDTCSEWRAAGYNLLTMAISPEVGTATEKEAIGSSVVRNMIEEMDKHNSALEDERDALLRLLQLAKRPYVPEKLRRLLAVSEKDVSGRTDVEGGYTCTPSLLHKGGKGHKLGRRGSLKRSARLTAEEEKDIRHNVALLLSNASTSIEKELLQKERQQQHPQNGQLQVAAGVAKTTRPYKYRNKGQPAAEVVTSVNPAVPPTSTTEFAVHRQGANNVVVIDPEEQLSKEPKTRRRRMRRMDDGTFTCARVVPFIFEPQHPGTLTKPVRGNPNPDKRLLKRMTPHLSGYSAPLERVAVPYGVHHMGMGDYYVNKSMPYGLISEPHSQIKRIRPAPPLEGRVMAESATMAPANHQVIPSQAVVVPKLFNQPHFPPRTASTQQVTLIHTIPAGEQIRPAVHHQPGVISTGGARVIGTRPAVYQPQRRSCVIVETADSKERAPHAVDAEATMSSALGTVGSKSETSSNLDFLASISATMSSMVAASEDNSPSMAPAPADQKEHPVLSQQQAPPPPPVPAAAAESSMVNAFNLPLVNKLGMVIDQETTTLGTVLADPTLRSRFLSAAVSRQQQFTTPACAKQPAAPTIRESSQE